MTLLLNILWFVLGGFLVSIAYILGGLLLCITVIGIPFGIQCFKLSLLGLAPFGRQVRETEPPVRVTSEHPRNVAEQVLELVGSDADAEVTVNAGTSALTRFANSFIHQNVGEEGATVSLRLAVDGRVASGTTTNLGADSLDRFVADTTEAARVQPVDPDWPGLVAPTAIPDLEHFDPAAADASPELRAEQVKAFVDAGPDLSAAVDAAQGCDVVLGLGDLGGAADEPVAASQVSQHNGAVIGEFTYSEHIQPCFRNNKGPF